MVKRYFIFVIGGGIGALINLAITYALTEFFSLWYILGYVLGSTANVVFNFFYHREITFGVKDEIRSRFLKFMAVNVIIGISSVSFVYVLTEWLDLWYMLSAVLTIVSISVINFMINRFWVFRYSETELQQKIS